MLIHEPRVLQGDPILNVVARVCGDPPTSELRPGVYLIGHFGSSDFLQPDYEQYPEDLKVGPYGVCDSLEQLLAACPELEAPGREFVVTLHLLCKADEPARGGWRWHKWGEYIGTQQPQCEYLYDEPEIEQVYVYHIYEKKQNEHRQNPDLN